MICTRCNLEKEEEQFNWRKTGVKRHSYCKACHSKANKINFIKHKESYQKSQKVWNERYKEKHALILIEHFKANPCVDCGADNPLFLDLDHKNRSEKIDNVSTMINRKLPTEVILNEIAKCEVRCANCHRIKSAKEGGYEKLKHLEKENG